jgi:hypothetical protein
VSIHRFGCDRRGFFLLRGTVFSARAGALRGFDLSGFSCCYENSARRVKKFTTKNAATVARGPSATRLGGLPLRIHAVKVITFLFGPKRREFFGWSHSV